MGLPGDVNNVRLQIMLKDIQQVCLKLRRTKHATSLCHLQVTEAYYSYPLISLVAEFGGYVGLFLGVAVIQAGDILGGIGKKLANMATKRSRKPESTTKRIVLLVSSSWKLGLFLAEELQ